MKKACQECGAVETHAKGLCHACYNRKNRARYRERRREKQRAWRAANPEKVKQYRAASPENPEKRNARIRKYRLAFPERQLARTLRSKYKISIAEVQELKAAQGGRCARCASPDATSRLQIDHCHRTGKVRGLLCRDCNLWLGYLEKRIARVGYAGIARDLDYAESAGESERRTGKAAA